MVVGIMQPYLFPYLGYFQLVGYCDHFVFFDDANYIKKGFVNRNRLLMNGEPYQFTLALEKASQNLRIDQLECLTDVSKLLKTVDHCYRRAPYYHEVFPLVEEVLELEDRNLASITIESISKVCEYLGLNLSYSRSSKIDYEREQGATAKIIDISRKLGADAYCNPLGGRSLYKSSDFYRCGVSLQFLEMGQIRYPQGKSDFIEKLSIVDVLMWNSKDRVVKMLDNYKIFESQELQ